MAKQYQSPPAMTIDQDKKYTATLETSRGTIVCDLFPRDAPTTVNNFVFLSREGFYDGTKFHRVIADFMIQGGDPTGTGRGGPGYRFEDELRNNPRALERAYQTLGLEARAGTEAGDNATVFEMSIPGE